MAQYGLKPINNKLCPKTDPAFTRALWRPDSKQGTSQDLKYPLNEELWQSLAKIQCPTLIMKGQASAILSQKTAEKMLGMLQHGQLEIINRAGHALMVDNPDAFKQCLSAFIDGINNAHS